MDMTDVTAGSAVAERVVALADRLGALDLAQPKQRAAFLRARALRLRARAPHARRRRQRDRLLARAAGLEMRARALDGATL